uniref:Golgi SNAP receptor complex member 1 n=1 Tax=Urocitellus parryii TaxID=9999 RepID=A0A8D2ICR7_UROPR
MAAGMSNYWEDLRKQAQQVENELDLKLVSFSKLCTSYNHSIMNKNNYLTFMMRNHKSFLENLGYRFLFSVPSFFDSQGKLHFSQILLRC